MRPKDVASHDYVRQYTIHYEIFRQKVHRYSQSCDDSVPPNVNKRVVVFNNAIYVTMQTNLLDKKI